MREDGFVIGVDLGGTNVRAAAVDHKGKVLATAERPSEVLRGSQRILTNIESVAMEASKPMQAKGKPLLAMGVGAAGPINVNTGVIHQAPNIPQWKRFPLRGRLSQVFPCPVFLENDANVATLGEGWVGAAKGKKNFLMLTLGTGVGGGVINEGRLVHGAAGMAGELGHMVVEASGARCNCGSRGCIEVYASATGIKRLLREKLKDKKDRQPYINAKGELDVARIYQAAKARDRVAREVLTQAGSYLGVAMASLINIFNPEMIVIGGGVAQSWDLLIPAAKKEVDRRAFRIPARLARIVPAKLGPYAGWLGAAYVAWQGLER